MRIALWHNLPSGGGKRALYHQVKGLLERGHQVEVWCPPQADNSFLPLRELVREHIVPCGPITHPALVLPRSWRDVRADYKQIVQAIQLLDRHCQLCAAEINQGNFDVLFANPGMHLRASSVGRHVALPRLLFLHEPQRMLYEARPQLAWVKMDELPQAAWQPTAIRARLHYFWKLAGLRRLAQEEFRNTSVYDMVLANSAFSRESILRAYGLDSKVCYLGIDAEQFKYNGAARERFVVGLGALHPDKGVERAIRAIGSITPKQRPRLVWIANFANPAYKRSMLALARELEVVYLPHVALSESEVVDWLSRASVMLYTPYLEPFGFAPLEANACETPVVAVAEGGIRETMHNGLTGSLLSDGDPTSLGQAVLKYLQDPALARAIGSRARRNVVENWTWESSVGRLEQHLTRVANLAQRLEPISNASTFW